MLGLFKRKEVSNFERIEKRLHEELGIDLLNVNPRVIAKYKFKVNSSKNCLLSDEQVILKLNRDFYCSNVTSKENEYIISKQYGSLRITYNKARNEISSIWNEHYPINLCIDELLKTKMNEIMELN